MTERVLVTGANGFVGQALLPALSGHARWQPLALVRRRPEHGADSIVAVGDINASTDYAGVIKEGDVIVHLAARVHVMEDRSSDPLQAYRQVNVDGTLNLARQAAAAGARRFVFVSSIKVNGESTTGAPPFDETAPPAPQDAYGQSKLEAEQGLLALARDTGMEVVILRPPLVYGPGVKANFRSLMALAAKPLPLPFASVGNRRSMVFVGNLVDLVIRCLDHPAAANEVFLVSDGQDVSLRSLLTLMRTAAGRGPGLFPVPPALFRLLGKLTGRAAVVDRLLGDLQVDSHKAQRLLGWQPPYSVARGVALAMQELTNGSH